MMDTVKPMNRYMHLKTGNIYIKMGLVVNATNAQDGQEMVVYRKEDSIEPVFVRETGEFLEKFQKIE